MLGKWHGVTHLKKACVNNNCSYSSLLLSFALLLKVCLLSCFSYAGDSLNNSANVSAYEAVELQPHMAYLLDPNGNITIEQLLNRPDDFTFKPLNKKSLPRLQTSTWLKVTINNAELENDRFIINFEEMLFDQIDFYYQQGVDTHSIKHYQTGLNFKYDSRPIRYRFIAFPITIEKHSSKTVYFRIISSHMPLLAPAVTTVEGFADTTQLSGTINVLALGISLGLCLFGLLFIVITAPGKEVTSFWIYLVFTSLVIFSVSGMFAKPLANYPEWHKFSMVSLLAANSISNLIMVNCFLDISNKNKKQHIAYLFMGIVFLLFIIGYPVFGGFEKLIVPVIFTTIMMFGLLFYSAIWAIKQNINHAKLFLLGLSLFFFTVIYASLGAEGLVPYNAFIRHCIGFGVCIQAFIYCSAIARKVFDDQQLQIDLQQEVIAAKAANAEKSQFLATMSHEIRTPVNGIIGMSELMSETELNTQQRHYNKIVQSSADALLHVINDILDISKIEAGKMDLQLEGFSVQKLVEDLYGRFIWQMKDKGLALHTQVDEKIPTFMHGDIHKIKQILSNFLSNALKFTDKGDIDIRLQLIKQYDETYIIKFSILDTGIGIEDDQINKLFESFSQVDDSSTRQYGGTGLGLAISKELAQLMGGKVGFDSLINNGSEFWLELPLRISERADEYQNEQRLLSKKNLKEKAIILIAEDNLVNQQVIVSMLQSLDLQPITTCNGDEAVHYYKQNAQFIDLVLMDCEMPSKDGYSATEEIRVFEQSNKLASCPIVAITAHAFLENKERCLAAGMNDVLTKPVRLNELHNVLDTFMPHGLKSPSTNA